MRFWVIAAAALAAAHGAEAKTHRKSQAEAPVVGDVNGVWRIEATTSVGNCPALIPESLQIADNRIAAAPGGALTPWGYVDSDGTIVARFTDAGGRVARFHGALRGARGSGAWSSSTDMCGGAWRAARE